MWVLVVLLRIETRVGISDEIKQKDILYQKKHTIGLNNTSDASFRPWMWRPEEGGGS